MSHVRDTAAAGNAIRTAIVGCGRVAEMHMLHLRRNPRAKVVAAIDDCLEAAKRFAQKHTIPRCFKSLEDAILDSQIEAAHITTPPDSHEDLARYALEHGVHVFVEKPQTFSVKAARELYALASAKGLQFLPDFILLGSPLYRQMKHHCDSGKLGKIVSVDCVYNVGYDSRELKEPMRPPWPFLLPGGYLHNYITHPLYLCLSFTGALRQISTSYRNKGALPSYMTDTIDVLADGYDCSASIRVSLAPRISPINLTIYGELGTARVEFASFVLSYWHTSRLPGGISRMIAPAASGVDVLRQSLFNTIKVATGKLVRYEGLQNLIEDFHNSIEARGPSPVAPELAMEVIRVEEAIIRGGGNWKLRKDDVIHSIEPTSKVVAVTGANGYIGAHVARTLQEKGYHVKALVRAHSVTDNLLKSGMDIIVGDAREITSVRRLMQGADFVVHLAAGTRGTRDFVLSSCVDATRNVVQVAEEIDLRRNVYLSSYAVYDYVKAARLRSIDENTPLESKPGTRSSYAEGKTLAEQVVRESNARTPRWSILRPSSIFGSSRSLLDAVALKIGERFMLLGEPKCSSRLVHVDDVVSAVLMGLEDDRWIPGDIINITHPDTIILGDLQKLIVNETQEKCICLSPSVLRLAGLATAFTYRALHRGPHYTQRQITYLCSGCHSRPGKALSMGWRPSAPLREQIVSTLQQSK
ncbi:MAG TPA: NAD-dependent epimerase/dehydratase family protein [Bacillota bacterium]|nr:NAD-dependent epimerase/dehydratase family protein [Bacillota bacterium]